jgi:uncharacterized protein (TIGR00725 family)
MIQIAVCGPADCTEDEWVTAHEIGVALASHGATVICGGYGGVMAAVAAGARSAGGLVVGILSGPDREGAGPDLSVVLPTGMGQARNMLIVNAADAVIIVGGSWGTLSELAMAARTGRVPVIQLGGWHILDQGEQRIPAVLQATTPAEAIKLTGLFPT